jgi:hypothetical protein
MPGLRHHGGWSVHVGFRRPVSPPPGVCVRCVRAPSQKAPGLRYFIDYKWFSRARTADASGQKCRAAHIRNAQNPANMLTAGIRNRRSRGRVAGGSPRKSLWIRGKCGPARGSSPAGPASLPQTLPQNLTRSPCFTPSGAVTDERRERRARRWQCVPNWDDSQSRAGRGLKSIKFTSFRRQRPRRHARTGGRGESCQIDEFGIRKVCGFPQRHWGPNRTFCPF